MLPLIDDLRANKLDKSQLPAAPIDGLYVHIPFCFHKCHYCDFYSITRQSPERMEQFVGRVLDEARLWNDSAVRPRIKTVFFGGGTPSLLPVEQMARLLTGLQERFDLSGVNEWTVEVNPATANLDALRSMRALGVTRISLGAQSFEKSELATLERHHDPFDVEMTIDLAQQAGFERINLDLIYAIPGQTLTTWLASIERAIDLGVDHISAYALTYEPSTPLAVLKRLGRIKPADESLELEMLRLVRARLESSGLYAYEISNHARPGQECRHNLMYWTGGSYMGLGPSAASHVAGVRFKNLPHIRHWEQAIDARTLPWVDVEFLSPAQRAGERIMLGLRLARGVSLREIGIEFDVDLLTQHHSLLCKLKSENLIVFDDDQLKLTARGVELSDAISSEFVA